MIIRCTQKLLKELKQVPAGLEPETDPFWSWHANMFYVERRKCVLVTNDATLFAIFMPGLRSPDFKNFSILFGQRLFKVLLDEKIPQKQIETVLTERDDIRYEKTNNRRVLGTMIDQKFQLEYKIEAEGGLEWADIYVLNRYVNHSIYSAIDYRHPVERFKEKLQNLT